MFTIITIAAVPGYFTRAGEVCSSAVYEEATAADALRIARELADSRRYAVVGIRVGNRRKSSVLWIK